jgi:hypothetical protein
LAKRLVYVDPQGKSRLVDLTALELVQSTCAGYGETAAAERREDVTILDIFGNAAVVKIDASTWVDYLEAIRWTWCGRTVRRANSGLAEGRRRGPLSPRSRVAPPRSGPRRRRMPCNG